MAFRLVLPWLAAVLLVMAVPACGDSSDDLGAAGGLKIGLLLNYSGSPNTAADRQRAFDLAIKHVNAGGGVLGKPVEGFTANISLEPQVGIEAARELVEVKGVSAIVGPSTSAASLPISETVIGPAGIPTISPVGHVAPIDYR